MTASMPDARDQCRQLGGGGDGLAVPPAALTQVVEVARLDHGDGRPELREEPAGRLDWLAPDLDDVGALEQGGLRCCGHR